MTTEQLQKTFRPKTGKKQHWFYKKFIHLTKQEIKQADDYWDLFMKEWKERIKN